MKKTETIAFLNPHYPDPQTGGIEAVTDSLAREFAKRGYNCIYIHTERPAKLPKDIAPFASAVCIQDKDFDPERFIIGNNVDIIINNCSHYKTELAEMFKGVGRRRIISVFHSLPGFDLAMMKTLLREKKHKGLRGPVRKRWRLLNYEKYAAEQTPLIKAKRQRTVEYTDKMVVLAAKSVDRFIEAYDIPEDMRPKFTFIGNPLRFPYSPDISHIPDKQKEVLIVSRLEEAEKRISLALKIWGMVEASGLFPDWKLTIVGRGTYEKSYRRLASKLKLRQVSFEGRQHSLPYYRRAAIFMLTSAFEGFPMVLPEAMQNGVVPIVFDSFDSVHDIITDGRNGFIVPDNDLAAFAAKLQLLMSDRVLRESMARDAVADAAELSVEKIADWWEELFDECAG